jgi:hypothetical protein
MILHCFRDRILIALNTGELLIGTRGEITAPRYYYIAYYKKLPIISLLIGAIGRPGTYLPDRPQGASGLEL